MPAETFDLGGYLHWRAAVGGTGHVVIQQPGGLERQAKQAQQFTGNGFAGQPGNETSLLAGAGLTEGAAVEKTVTLVQPGEAGEQAALQVGMRRKLGVQCCQQFGHIGSRQALSGGKECLAKCLGNGVLA